jgi:predicted transcriptional regulator
MILRDIVTLLEGQCLYEDADLDIEVSTACGADLMSDVLMLVHSGTLLITGLANPQVIRTAEVAEIVAVVLARGKVPPKETVDLAREKGIPLIQTPHTVFECCGRVYALGVEGCDVRGEERRKANRLVEEFLQRRSFAGQPQGRAR